MSPEYIVSFPFASSSVCLQVALRNERSWKTITHAKGKSRRKFSNRICVRKSRKLVGSSSSNKFGSCNNNAANLTRVCQPPRKFFQRTFQAFVLQLKLSRHLAASIIGLPRVTHQKFHRRFTPDRTDRADANNRAVNADAGCIHPSRDARYPAKFLQRVDLPAPFRPIKPTLYSSVRVNSASSRRVWPPYDFKASRSSSSVVIGIQKL